MPRRDTVGSPISRWVIPGYRWLVAAKSARTQSFNAWLATLWTQCQHSSWFFFPWHRMYLLTLESFIQHFSGDSQWSAILRRFTRLA